MLSKVCTKCEVDKPLTEYCKQAKGKMGVQPACKACMNIAYKNSRAKKHQHYMDVAKQRRQKYSQQFQEWKAQQKCLVCQEDEECCLDLHHLDPSEKEGLVSDMAFNQPWETLLLEINKCVVLCANCHRKVHAGKITLPL